MIFTCNDNIYTIVTVAIDCNLLSASQSNWIWKSSTCFFSLSLVATLLISGSIYGSKIFPIKNAHFLSESCIECRNGFPLNRNWKCSKLLLVKCIYFNGLMERYRDSIKTSTIIERGTEEESAKNKSQIVISINLKFELEFLCYKMQCMFFRKGIINTKCDKEKKKPKPVLAMWKANRWIFRLRIIYIQSKWSAASKKNHRMAIGMHEMNRMFCVRKHDGNCVVSHFIASDLIFSPSLSLSLSTLNRVLNKLKEAF